MWLCTTEIANRNKPLGEAGGWGGTWGEKTASQLLVTAFAFLSSLLPSQDVPTFSWSPATCRWLSH